jgi:DNA topoisomerase-2
LQGGDDAASARYTFTRLSPITRKIFPADDDPLLDYLNDDGQPIEPRYFVPIIPMILVNGTQGLGTGWSTFVPPYNPLEIIDNLLRKLKGEPMTEMIPWVRGFKGSVRRSGSSSFITCGIAELNDGKAVVSELPVRVWVEDYKELLEQMTRGKLTPTLRSYTEHHVGENVKFVLHFPPSKIPHPTSPQNLLKQLHLENRLSVSNMHLFDSVGNIKNYASPLHIIEEYFPVRLELYAKRRQHLLKTLQVQLERIKNRVLFIRAITSRAITVAGKPKAQILEEMKKYGIAPDENQSYDYLLSAPIYNLTQEKIDLLMQDQEKKEKEATQLKNTTPPKMWEQELIELRKAIQKEISS